ncbi:hypothetical protein [Ktedonobacter sp. SOSP1-52]|uniref:hypothetical protein n=1 Tax=Ktedonobacter sp. SOSP1-52 TaxID=2778366 RepID=UPI0019161993|nr:hypothetical protein [Ktedonobacter sp. SOSP1-52]
MQPKYDTLQTNEQDPQQISQAIAQELEIFLSPLLITLDKLLDKRLVRTVLQVCVATLRFRDQKQGLLLSELGSYLVHDEGKLGIRLSGGRMSFFQQKRASRERQRLVNVFISSNLSLKCCSFMGLKQDKIPNQQSTVMWITRKRRSSSCP